MANNQRSKLRVAAKNRRDQESVLISSICECLPFSPEALSKVDKISIIRLAISFINVKTSMIKELRRNIPAVSRIPALKGPTPVINQTGDAHVYSTNLSGDTFPESIPEGHLMLEALQGFVIFVNKRGKIFYVSENIEEHLGVSQLSLLGNPVASLIHPEDLPDLSKQFLISKEHQPIHLPQTEGPLLLGASSESARRVLSEDHKRDFYLRMKFQYFKTGGATKHTGYLLVQWAGRLKLRPSRKPCGYAIDGLLCLCRPMQPKSVVEIRLSGNMFVSRHDMGMKFTFCDPRIVSLIGYEPSEVIGKTAYYFHNPLDAPKISDCHSNLIVKGTSVSKYYRFFGKTGDWVWMQTRATIIYNSVSKPQYVICMNYVIGEEEGERYLKMEEEQQGFRDPNVRGCIDLPNTSTESPVSSCSLSGEDNHDDTGYSSSYTHTTESSPHNSTFDDTSSPETHVFESDTDSFLDDITMTDTEKSLKPTYDAPNQAAMSNELDPFLSSFRDEFELGDGSSVNGMDFFDELLRSMEDTSDCPQPLCLTQADGKDSQLYSLTTSKPQSLLRSLLNKSQDSMPETLPYPASVSSSKSSSSPSLDVLSQVSDQTQADSTLGSIASDLTDSEASASKKTLSLFADIGSGDEDDNFIPEELLDFAMQYCQSLAQEQTQPPSSQNSWKEPSSSISYNPVSDHQYQTLSSSAFQDSPIIISDTEADETVSRSNRRRKRDTVSVAKETNKRTPKDLSVQKVLNEISSSTVPTAKIQTYRSNSHQGTRKPPVPSKPASTQTMSSSILSDISFIKKYNIDSNVLKLMSAADAKQAPAPKSVTIVTCASGKGASGDVSKSRNSRTRLCSHGVSSVCSKCAPASMQTHPPHKIRPARSKSATKSSAAGKPPERMSELEKYLRGYIKRPHASSDSELLLSSKSSRSASESFSSSFLSQLLTGELSKEAYRELDRKMVQEEKRQRFSTGSM